MVQLLTTWYRTYQVLPQRTHPMMNMSGHGGALLVATKVLATGIISSTLSKEELQKLSRSKQGSRKRARPQVISSSPTPVCSSDERESKKDKKD